jgi:hypothetical protein
LKVQAHLVHADDPARGMVLQKVGHFFSSSASKAAMSAAFGRER